jgi:hypothetical protein
LVETQLVLRCDAFHEHALYEQSAVITEYQGRIRTLLHHHLFHPKTLQH